MKKLKGEGRKTRSEAGQSHAKDSASGSPAGLPLFLRRKAEAAFGRSLEDIRVHNDSKAAESARSLGAKAYTTGKDIVFGEGQYKPDTADGERLLAHELAHIVQQSGATPVAGISQKSDSLEQTADDAAGKVMSGVPAPIAPASSVPTIQREADPHLKPPPMLARAMGSGTVDDFITGSAALSSAQKAQIASLAASILSLREDYPSCSVSLTGHTDAVGDEAFNDALGQTRAESVKQELAANGVPPEIILTTGAGSHQLKVKTSAAEPRNRRVEIQFEPESRIHVLPEFKLPPVPSLTTPPPKDLTPPPLRPLSDAEEAGRRIFAPIPPPLTTPATPSKPLLEGVDKAMDSVLEKLGVPVWARPILKSGAKAAATKAVTAPLDAAMDQAHLKDNEKEAVRTAFKAAIEIAWP